MNRWRQRLAEMQGAAGSEPAPATTRAQIPAAKPTFEHFEQSEQRTEEVAAPAASPSVEAGEERATIVEDDSNAFATGRVRFGLPEIPEEPLLLRDGRRLWRFRAREIPSTPRGQTATLINHAHRCGTVLVADGRELVVVERWLSNLPPDILCELRLCADGVIAELLNRARARWQEATS